MTEKRTIPETGDDAASGAIHSMPQAPEPAAAQEWPAELDGEPLWTEGTWSGLSRFTCLWKVKHLREGGMYDLPCRLDFWSKDELMAHIRDDH